MKIVGASVKFTFDMIVNTISKTSINMNVLRWYIMIVDISMNHLFEMKVCLFFFIKIQMSIW